MPTGIKPVFINSATSTYGLIHPHDSKIFPDIPEHKDNPSQLRLQHDCLAIDDKSRLEPIRLVEYMVSGPGGMDPEVEIDDDTYDECREVLSRILEDAYTQSGTFRRLMNHAYDQELHDVEQRWLLGAGENFGTTVTEEDLVSSEGRKVIALNLDDTDDDSIPECYESNDGPQPFDTTRSFIHEVVHALTHLQDKEDNNPRGPVVEYTNIILKEMGHVAPPRIAYEFNN